MKRILKRILYFADIMGVNPIKFIKFIRAVPGYYLEYREINRQRASEGRDSDPIIFSPCLTDKAQFSGQSSGHYFHQDLWVASRVFANKPKTHIDIGSRIDGFVAHVAAFRTIRVLDIRSLNSTHENIQFIQADLMSDIPRDMIESCDSLSSLHAVEHFGLGRYGDPIRWDGYYVGFNNMLEMLVPGGKFYFSVPIGPQRIEFNAHRVFSLSHLLEMFQGKLNVDCFSYVDDLGDFHENIPLSKSEIEVNYNCIYGCGIFELTKI